MPNGAILCSAPSVCRLKRGWPAWLVVVACLLYAPRSVPGAQSSCQKLSPSSPLELAGIWDISVEPALPLSLQIQQSKKSLMPPILLAFIRPKISSRCIVLLFEMPSPSSIGISQGMGCLYWGCTATLLQLQQSCRAKKSPMPPSKTYIEYSAQHPKKILNSHILTYFSSSRRSALEKTINLWMFRFNNSLRISKGSQSQVTPQIATNLPLLANSHS